MASIDVRAPAFGKLERGPVRSARGGLGVVDSLDRVLLLLTLGRLLLIPLLILSFAAPLLTALALGVFIAADVYDGVLGRRRGADGPSRRALDSIVDRVAINAVFLALTVRGLLPPALLAFMLVRDAYCAYQCSRIMGERWIAVRADWMYKLLNLSLAAWVVAAPLLGGRSRVMLVVAILLYSCVVAADLTRAVRQVLALPADVRGVVIPAGVLRRARRRRAHESQRDLTEDGRRTRQAGLFALRLPASAGETCGNGF